MAELYSYTGTRIATGVKNKFGDTGGTQISDAMILTWINNGQRQIALNTGFLKATASCNLVAGIAAYALSTALAGARIITYHSVLVNGAPIKIVAWSEFEGLIEANAIQAQSGVPKFGADFGGTLTLWPVPASSIASGIVVYFTAYPADLVAIGDALTVPDRFYNALEDYVFAQALELDENFDDAGVKLGHYETEVRRQFEQENSSPTDFYPTMVLAPEDYDYQWFSR